MAATIRDETSGVSGKVGKKPGITVGHYTLLEKLGEGGFGEVYKAEQHEPVRRQVALKIIKPGMDTQQVVARFEVERQALALMEHPNIAKVLDGGVTSPAQGSLPYFVMELADGIPMTEYCDQHLLDTKERLNLMITVCHAIQHAHQKGVIHRDIKPANVLVVEVDGKPAPKIIDFGIAKAIQAPLTDKTLLTREGEFIGTPIYMSPEQAGRDGDNLDTRTDIYSLGVLLYELLTGCTPLDRHAWRQFGYEEVCRRIREKEPPKPSTRINALGEQEALEVARNRNSEPARLCRRLHGDLDWIVMKALEKDRNRRYATANGLAMDLSRFLKNEPVEAAAPSVGYRFRKFARRNKVILAAAGAVGCALVMGAAVSLWQAHQTAKQAETNRANSYAADMMLAQRELEMNNARAALALLNHHLPQPGEKDLRHWEWRYLRQLCRSDAISRWERTGTKETKICYLGDGQNIAVADMTGQLEIWDPARRKLLLQSKCDGNLLALRASLDGKILGATCINKRIHLWNAENYEKLADLECLHTSMDLAFSPDGKWLLSAGLEAAIWDLPSLTLLTNVTGGAASVDWSPKGDQIAIRKWHQGEIQVIAWPELTLLNSMNVETSNELKVLVRFSPDGKILASTGGFFEGWDESAVTLWDLPSGFQRGQLKGHQGYISALHFLSDGLTLATGSFDETIKLWDLQRMEKKLTLHGHLKDRRSPVWSLAAHPDGKTLLSTDDQGSIVSWDLEPTRREWHHAKLPEKVSDFALLPDSITLAVGSQGKIRLWDLNSLTMKETLQELGEDNLTVACESNGRRLVAASNNGTLKIWDLTNHVTLKEISGNKGRTFALGFFDHNRKFASMEAGGILKVWNTDSWQCIRTIPVHPLILDWPDPPLYGTGLSEKHAWFSAGKESRNLTLWDLNSGEELESLFLPGSKINIVAAFSPDGEWMAIGSDFLELRRTSHLKQEIAKIPAHRYGTLGVTFSEDGKRILTVSKDLECLKLWDLSSQREVLRLGGQGRFRKVAMSRDNNIIVARAFKNTIAETDLLLWKAPSMEELETADEAGLSRHLGKVPMITLHPQNVTVLEGRDAILEAMAFASEPFQYQWLHHSTNILAGETNATLTLTNVNGNYRGVYAVRVFNQHGSTKSSSANLEVIAQPRQLVQIGSWPGHIIGEAWDVAIQDNLAYLAASHAGLIIVDISDPANPQRLANYPTDNPAMSIDLAEHFAYVACWASGLAVFDVRDPAHPVLASFTETEGKTRGIKVIDNTAHVLNHDSSWLRFDVSDPTRPVKIGLLPTKGHPRDIEMVNKLAYVTAGETGLLIFDMSKPAEPVLLNHFNANTRLNRIQVDGQYAFLAGETSGMTVLDISDPIRPSLAGEYGEQAVKGLHVVDQKAYLARGHLGFEIADVSNPAKPVYLSNIPEIKDSRAIQKVGNHAYVAAWGSGLSVIDASDPMNPVEVGSCETGGASRAVDTYGSYLVVAQGGAGLDVLDASNPAHPQWLNRLSLEDCWDVQVAASYAFVACLWTGLKVIDLSHLPELREAGGLYLKGETRSVDVAVDFAYLASSGSGLRIVDIEDPTRPVERGVYDAKGGVNDVKVVGELAYLACSDTTTFQVIDVNNPAKPELVGSLTTGGDYGCGIEVAGPYAYLGTWDDGLHIIDVSHPENPVQVGMVKASTPVRDIQIQGPFAYMTLYQSGIQALDVSDPAHPFLLSRCDTPGTAFDVLVQGEHAFVADLEGGLAILKLSHGSRSP